MAAGNSPHRRHRHVLSVPRRLAAGAAILGAAVLPACDRDRQAEDVLVVGLGNPEFRHPIDFANRTEVLDV